MGDAQAQHFTHDGKMHTTIVHTVTYNVGIRKLPAALHQAF